MVKKYWWVGLIGLVVLVGGLGFLLGNKLKKDGMVFGNTFGRFTSPELLAYTTTTNANFGGIPVYNMEDYSDVGVTFITNTETTIGGKNGNVASSGTLRLACSTSETAPNIGAATSTTNIWTYVDFTNPETLTSYDGNTGYTHNTSSTIKTFVATNEVWKWCSPIWKSDSVMTPGLVTTSVYVKRVNS